MSSNGFRRYVFSPTSGAPYRVSRSKIELFMNCRRCFYLDRRLGIPQPPGYPFNLNTAVDTLLKKEFDIHRAAGTAHPLMKTYGVDAVPYQHPKMDEWRDALRRGVQYLHSPTNFLVTGGVDDVWVNPQGELIVVDYKATAKETEVTIDAPWQISYKRQMEVYQWLFRRNEFTVSPTGYFVYCNGDTDREAFDGKLEFNVKIIPYTGDDAWVEPTLLELRACLQADTLPSAAPACAYCTYRAAARRVE
ncbi:MAG: PD-(D/E)XK nuclease family protein [bacterium]|nr:PD-(D/E)XK nuclease family protein [bacterium]